MQMFLAKLIATLTTLLALLHPAHLQPHVNYGGITPTPSQLSQDAAIDIYTIKGSTLETATTSTITQAGTETVDVDTTQPKVTLSKWNGEVGMGVTLQGMAATGARKFMTNEVDWQTATETMSVIPLAASSTFEDGGYAIDITLASKPSSNVFNFSIDGAQNLDFFYQAPLWQEAGLNAPTKDCTSTSCFIDGQMSRPENIVGSYAVYYKQHYNHVIGFTNYATGKAFQIFRPLVTDATASTTWATLSYSAGILIITVPQNFLDNAVYPVTVDPTMGYTTIGGTSVTKTNGNTNTGSLNSQYTAVTGDTITVFNLYGAKVSADCTVDLAAYTISGGLPASRVAAAVTITENSTTNQWWTSSVSQNLVNGTTYDAAVGNWGNATGVNIFEDTTSGNQRSFTAATGALTDPWVNSSTDSQQFSLYATVAAAGGGGTTKTTIVEPIFFQ